MEIVGRASGGGSCCTRGFHKEGHLDATRRRCASNRKKTPGTTFHSRVPRNLLKTSRAVGKNYDNIFRPPWMNDKFSRAMTRVLRHDPRLNVDGHGFAYCEDIPRALGNREIYHLTAS